MSHFNSLHGLFIRTYNQQSIGHRHPYDQITIPIMGSIEMIMNRKPLTVSYGEAVYVPKHTYHQFKAQGTFRFLVVNLSQSLQSVPKDPNAIRLNRNLHFTLDEKTLILTKFIEKQLISATNSKIEGLMYDLLIEQLATIKINEKIDSRIINCLNVINKDISAAHNLRTLSKIACLSESQFKVIFKENLGCTAYDYITGLRMQKALGLLINTDIPISSIAEECGYKSVSAFIHRFRNYYHQTPSKMRIRPNDKHMN